jgi:catechol-2,3-dioxygenase
MPLERLDHVNLRTQQLEAQQRFYRDVLGLTLGARPNFSFGGAWLYCGERPVVHLVAVESASAPTSELTLQHFAFAATGLAELLSNLERHHVPRRVGFVRDFNLCQVHVHDPDGNHIHIDFALAEAEALGLAG